MNNQSYIKTIYGTDERPVTSYPDELTKYICNRFGISGGVLVDVGCGRGDFLYGFQKAGMEAVGIDREKIDTGKSIIGGIDLEKDEFPFDDNSVDVVFTKSVLEHIHRPDKMLHECYRILKPGGRIIAMVPDWQTCMHIYYDDHTHVQPYTATGLKDCLRMFGFKGVTSEQFYQLPIVWKYPKMKILCKMLQCMGPVKKVSKNKFYRFSRELILLGTGTK